MDALKKKIRFPGTAKPHKDIIEIHLNFYIPGDQRRRLHKTLVFENNFFYSILADAHDDSIADDSGKINKISPCRVTNFLNFSPYRGIYLKTKAQKQAEHRIKCLADLFSPKYTETIKKSEISNQTSF